MVRLSRIYREYMWFHIYIRSYRMLANHWWHPIFTAAPISTPSLLAKLQQELNSLISSRIPRTNLGTTQNWPWHTNPNISYRLLMITVRKVIKGLYKSILSISIIYHGWIIAWLKLLICLLLYPDPHISHKKITESHGSEAIVTVSMIRLVNKIMITDMQVCSE